jgi:hypothetical protein
MFGSCDLSFDCQSSNGSDITKKLYITKMSKSMASSINVSVSNVNTRQNEGENMDKGWALKAERKTKRFNENQKSFLVEKFNIGLKTGRKEDPISVAEAMLTARTEDGSRRFSYDEILSVQQVTSFFSRMNRKNKTCDDSDYVEAFREETIQNLRREFEN